MEGISHGLLSPRRETRRRLVAALVAACALPGLGSSGAAAQDEAKEQAKAHFQSGVKLYDQGEHARALESFQEAYRLSPHPVVRVNMANCYDRMDKPIEAIFHFERYLEESEAKVKPRQRKEVKAALKRLRKKVGQVRLQVVPDGVSIRIDDAEQRQSPVVEPVLMVAGIHYIDARLEGYRPVRRSINVAGGDTTEVTITMQSLKKRPVAAAPVAAPVAAPEEPAAEPAPAGEEETEPLIEELAETPELEPVEEEPEPMAQTGQRDSLGRGTPVLIVGAATAVLAVATAVTGVMAIGADADYDYLSSKSTLDNRERADARETAARANDLALATDILLGVTAVGAVVTTVLLLTRERQPESPDSATAPGSATASAWAAPTGAGVVMTGAF
jgi:hypothetical protein